MARTAAIIMAGWVLVLSPLMVFGNDAPHNETFNIQCYSCHGQNLKNSLNDSIKSPFWDRTGLNDSLENDRRNLLCQSCHNEMTSGYTDIKAPLAKTHSSYTIGSWFRSNDSNWSRLCTDCHNPHYQDQKNNYDRSKYNDSTEWKAPIYLASGIITGYSYDNESNHSYLYYYNTTDKVHFKKGWDFDRIANKTLENRHAILLPNIASPSFNYSILQINENAGIMTVMGDVSKGIYRYQTPTSEADATNAKTPKKYFGIIYGQLLKSKINGKKVVFYDNTGNDSFADNDSTKDGICEVCHTKTDHFRFNGSAPDQEHYNPVKDAQGNTLAPGKQKTGTNCIECHRHELGFHHSNDGGTAACTECHNSNKHPQHLNGGESCSGCHDLNNMRDAEGKINSPLLRILANDSGNVQYSCSRCHNNAVGGPPNDVDYINHWNDSNYTVSCSGCHNGRPSQLDPNNKDQKFKTKWNDSAQAFYNESLVMSSGGHNRLVGPNSIRHYPCSECHFLSIKISSDKTSWSYKRKHTNGQIDVDIDPAEAITGISQMPYYDSSVNAITQERKNCFALYCHSDGTQRNPDVRPYSWFGGGRRCNFCHGHDENSNCGDCHSDGRVWNNDNMWFSAMPMYPNEGAGAGKANSHFKHILNEGKSCDFCHSSTVKGGSCIECHKDANGESIQPSGQMQDNAHINPDYHVNHEKTVTFKDAPMATYDLTSKTCRNTPTTGCHGPKAMIWGSAVDGKRACYSCHVSVTGNDTNDYGGKNDIQARISQQDWLATGHGRLAASGPYPESGNPAANFNDSNECWYCHDPGVMHPGNKKNPFRLRMHESFSRRFEKECMYCHNTESTAECLSCHYDYASRTYAPQIGIATTNDTPRLALFKDEAQRLEHVATLANPSCVIPCHVKDEERHKIGSNDTWTEADKADVRNQYMMMGVCLQCHDDDSGGQCNSCHAYGDNDSRYQRGFDPKMNDSRLIVPVLAKASSAHFGYKHYLDYQRDGTWKGGKFCWDCHDPHGDKNIYMIHDKVALATEGTYGQPTFNNDTGKWNQADVVFVAKDTGTDYARSLTGPYNGICQVCHTDPPGGNDSHLVAAHYTSTKGDLHNYNQICTSCHEHRFTNSHSSGQDCDSCHRSKPIPRHTAFSLPRDCTKCHRGIRKRIDVMGQFKGNSHHVQRPDGTVNNVDCYPCHWESTAEGLINVEHHEGYNYKNHSGTKDERVDLILMGPNGRRPLDGNETRPSEFKILNDSNSATATATVFYANTIGTANERTNVERITPHCLSCHSDQNNEIDTFFGDCKTPRQYSWDGTSIAARYSNLGTTVFGKYADHPSAAPKNIIKAFSAHGNAKNNAGGFSTSTGVDGAITNTRAGSRNVQCFDCHSSHGSKVSGVTTAYMDYKGGYNGGNLKETKAGEGGYVNNFAASKNSNEASVNPYKDQAGQCFDCHETATANTGTKPKPWGYNSTYGATQPIVGYKDNKLFKGKHTGIYTFKNDSARRNTVGGHLKAETPLLGLNGNTPQGSTKGICTPCHDPHGVTPSIGTENMAYAVPLLKGTWLTSPYKEDSAMTRTTNQSSSNPGYRKLYIDRNTFTTGIIYESEDKFAGLCLRCHTKNSLTDGTKKNTAWKSLDRVHETVKGWGNNAEHNYPCSKCHQPHASGLPRLMTTNCLDAKHRGNVETGGIPYRRSNSSSTQRYPQGNNPGYKCHDQATASGNTSEWEDQRWNTKTLWPNDSFNHGL